MLISQVALCVCMFLKSVFCFIHVSVFVTIPHCRPHFRSSVTVGSPTGAFLFFGEHTHASLPQGICAFFWNVAPSFHSLGGGFSSLPASQLQGPPLKSPFSEHSLKQAPKSLHIPLFSYCILGYPKQPCLCVCVCVCLYCLSLERVHTVAMTSCVLFACNVPCAQFSEWHSL